MKKSVFVLMAMVFLINCVSGYAQKPTSKEALANAVLSCAACHGAKGVSANPLWPNLAGQHRSYLRKQLKDYQQGETRPNAVMTALAKSLSPAELDALADYYAALPQSEGTTPKQYLARGEKIYRGGDFSNGIPACIACHGPQGHGNAEAGFPNLSGQHAAYTLQQLLAFRDKKRRNDLNGIMQDTCARMNQEDMEAVAYYMQGLY